MTVVIVWTSKQEHISVKKEPYSANSTRRQRSGNLIK